MFFNVIMHHLHCTEKKEKKQKQVKEKTCLNSISIKTDKSNGMKTRVLKVYQQNRQRKRNNTIVLKVFSPNNLFHLLYISVCYS